MLCCTDLSWLVYEDLPGIGDDDPVRMDSVTRGVKEADGILVLFARDEDANPQLSDALDTHLVLRRYLQKDVKLAFIESREQAFDHSLSGLTPNASAAIHKSWKIKIKELMQALNQDQNLQQEDAKISRLVDSLPFFNFCPALSALLGINLHWQPNEEHQKKWQQEYTREDITHYSCGLQM